MMGGPTFTLFAGATAVDRWLRDPRLHCAASNG